MGEASPFHGTIHLSSLEHIIASLSQRKHVSSREMTAAAALSQRKHVSSREMTAAAAAIEMFHHVCAAESLWAVPH